MREPEGSATATTAGHAALRTRFGTRLADLGGRLHEVASLAAARQLARELIAGATVARWADWELDEIVAAETPAAEAEVSLIRADVAVAETGAIGFAHGVGRSRGAGVLPARQIALLHAEDLVAGMAAALARFHAAGARPPSNVVFAAGPSRTADIEQRRIVGVHAPRELDVIVFAS